jgi:hypothetical protein
VTTESWVERTGALLDRFGMPAINADYVGFEAACWNCGRHGPVFLWPGIRDWRPPPAPSPTTVKVRFSKTLGESYPANGCIHCDAMFGDFYLFDLLLDSLEYEEAGELADRFLNDADVAGDESE